MSANFVQDGDLLDLAAPYAVNSGAGAKIGLIFGVAMVSLAINQIGTFAVEGVWDLAKTSAETWTVGQKVYWDDTNKLVTTTAGSNIAIGVVTKAAAAGVTVGRVRLNATFV